MISVPIYIHVADIALKNFFFNGDDIRVWLLKGYMIALYYIKLLL